MQWLRRHVCEHLLIVFALSLSRSLSLSLSLTPSLPPPFPPLSLSLSSFLPSSLSLPQSILSLPPNKAVNGDLIPFLIELLESPLAECDKPSATKALIAESLKAMAKDLANGEKVSTMQPLHIMGPLMNDTT